VQYKSDIFDALLVFSFLQTGRAPEHLFAYYCALVLSTAGFFKTYNVTFSRINSLQGDVWLSI